jgi:hypothetical protein
MVDEMKLILGHNQFIGISHISEEKSREKEKKFSKVENIYHVVESASELGYDGIVLETHPRMLKFLEYYERNKTFDINFYLQVPYVQGFIQRMNEDGIANLTMDITRQIGLAGLSGLSLKGAVSSLRGDYLSLATTFLSLELYAFAEFKIKALFLHNVVTDLLLALKMQDPFSEYLNFVEDQLQVTPGFVTLNFPLLKNSFERWGIRSPLVMTPINPKGYDMNPSKKAVEEAIKKYNSDIIAMNVLGGGAFSLGEVHSYLESFDNINYCVIGASSRDHLKEAAEVFNSQSKGSL